MGRSAFVLSSLLFVTLAHAASFDCAKARTRVEHIICDNPEISRLDEKLEEKYKMALKDKAQASVKQTQKEWLKGRNTCTDAACVKTEYEARLTSLTSELVAAGANELFPACSDVTNTPDYLVLKQYLSRNNIESDLCQRLNDQEFLYTDSMSINYCKLSQGDTLTCDGELYPNLEVASKFTGSRGRQFVLFRVQRLSHGIFGEGYHVFFLVPKRINPRGYMLFFFPKAGAGDNNDGSGECNEDDKKPITIALDPHFEVINENQSNVGVRFNQERIDCSTGSKKRQILEYTWRNFGFQLTKSKIVTTSSAH